MYIRRSCSIKLKTVLKILQISSARSLGGGERHLADLTYGLSRRGHDVLVASRSNAPLIDELRRIPRENILHWSARNAVDAQSARQLHKIVRQYRIQIVHAHMGSDYPFAAYATRRPSQARLIVSRHVLFPINRLDRIGVSKATRVIAVSEAVAAQLRAGGIHSPDKIKVVLNGIEVERFAKARDVFDRRTFLQEWKLPEDVQLVGTIGELTPLKGQSEFLYAAAIIAHGNPQAHFVVAGIDHSPQQQHRKAIESLIVKLGLQDRVRLVGWLPHLSELYCALDVFVSASHTESFGLVIAEAMASGTAVVATATDGAREIIGSEENAMMVQIEAVDQLAAAINSLLNNPQRRRQLAQNGQNAVQRFNIERMIDETELVYQEALAIT